MSSRWMYSTLTAALLCPAAALAALVGPANDYNVFVFGTGSFASQFSDTEGSMAAGGNVSLNGYTVASAIAGNPALAPNPARLVVGGNLQASNGGVGVGQNGALYVGGTTSLTSFTATGGQFGQTLVDFSAAETLYRDLSLGLGALGANGTTTLQAGSNTLTLNGSSTTLNVFSLSAADLTASQSVVVNAPGGSTVLVNVFGPSATFQNGQVSFAGGASSAYLLYNFVNATSVLLPGSKDPRGAVLAPLAGVQGGFGAMTGQLVTGSFGGLNGAQFGNTQFNLNPFQGELPGVTPIPLPAAGWLLLSAVAGLSMTTRRRRARDLA